MAGAGVRADFAAADVYRIDRHALERCAVWGGGVFGVTAGVMIWGCLIRLSRRNRIFVCLCFALSVVGKSILLKIKNAWAVESGIFVISILSDAFTHCGMQTAVSHINISWLQGIIINVAQILHDPILNSHEEQGVGFNRIVYVFDGKMV